ASVLPVLGSTTRAAVEPEPLGVTGRYLEVNYRTLIAVSPLSILAGISTVPVGPIDDVEAVVAVQQQGAMILPIGRDRGVPVADPVHLLKAALEQVAAQTVSLEIVSRPEPLDEEPILRRVRPSGLPA